jgi:hypothetical protein
MQDLPPLAHLLADARIAALIAAPAPAFLIDSAGKLRFANRAGLALRGARTLAKPSPADPKARSVRFGSGARADPDPFARRRSASRTSAAAGGFAQPIVFAATRFNLGRDGDAAARRHRRAASASSDRLAAAALVDGEHGRSHCSTPRRAIHFNAAAPPVRRRRSSPISIPGPHAALRPPSATASHSPRSAVAHRRFGASRPGLRH